MNKSLFTSSVIVFFILVPIISFGQSRKLVRQGKKLTDPQQQIQYYTDAIDLDSENLDAYFYRGIARANLENHWGAMLDFTTVIFKKPDADSYFNRGNSKYAIEDYKGAYEDYNMAIKYDRSFFQAYYNLGITQLHLQKFSDALKSFSFLMSHYPNDSEILTQMGQTLMALKHYKLSLLFFNKTIKLNNNSDAFYNRGMAYLDMKDYKKAMADFNKAISLNPKNDAAHFYLGISQLFKRNYAKAAERFKHTLSYNSLDHEALVGLAIAYYHIDDHDKARLCFRKAKNILTPTDISYRIDDISLFENTTWNLNEGFIFEAYFDKLNTL